MKAKSGTELAVSEFIRATCPPGMSEREKHLFRESLYSLVRLARSELMVEIRTNAARLAGMAGTQPRRSRSDRQDTKPVQQRFEFNQ